ncbi:unnamed protein product [Prunus armeniaca]
MATTNRASTSLKLLVDTKSHKVLFAEAEASKEVVDFLFSNLYESAETLSVDSYLPLNLKDTLLKPKKQQFLRPISFNCHCRPTMTRAILRLAMSRVFNVKGIDALQVKEVDLGMQEGLKLLKASLKSNTAHTNVFLGKKQQKLFNFGPLETLSFWGFILKTHPPSQQSFNFIVDPKQIRRPILY